jgi:sulfatase maturation enzyme AslB (radical SAM superfamily)
MTVQTTQKLQPDDNNVDINFRDVLNRSLKIFFKDAVRTTLRNPLLAYYFIRTVGWQKKAAKLREDWENRGVHVPPIMIFSITDRCNLSCKGCYNKELRQSPKEEMSAKKSRKHYCRSQGSRDFIHCDWRG